MQTLNIEVREERRGLTMMSRFIDSRRQREQKRDATTNECVSQRLGGLIRGVGRERKCNAM